MARGRFRSFDRAPRWAVIVMVVGTVGLLIGFSVAGSRVPPKLSKAEQDRAAAADSATAASPSASATPVAAPTPKGTLTLNDTFDRPDSKIVGTAPTGQQWSQSGPAGCAIRDGRVVADKRLSNCYLSTTLPTPATALRADGSWSGQGDLQNGVTLITSTDKNYALNNMVHFNLRPRGWILQFRTAGGTFDNIADGNLNLSVDGTVYSWGMYIDGNTVTLALPDGAVRKVTDPRVGQLNGPYITYEMGSSEGQMDSRVEAVQAYSG